MEPCIIHRLKGPDQPTVVAGLRPLARPRDNAAMVEESPTPHAAGSATPYIIVVGNEKGGTGKSTTVMHVVVSLLRHGHKTGVIDLDAAQGTVSRYLTNRSAYAERHGYNLPQPLLQAVYPSKADRLYDACIEEQRDLRAALAALSGCEFIVIDTPGNDTALSRLGHAHADTLITPINDSFVDLDLLAQIDPDTLEVVRPSRYAQMVWEQKQERVKLRAEADRDRDQRPRQMDWIVVRNRLSSLNSRNKRNMHDVLTRVGARIGFRPVAGFGDRVVFRELFLKGLTLLDLRDVTADVPMTMSHVAARQEVRGLLNAIGFNEVSPISEQTAPASAGAADAA